jgi:hypothetical protein
MRYDLQKAMQELVEGMKFASGYAIIAMPRGDPGAPRCVARGADISSYPIFVAAKSKDSAFLIARTKPACSAVYRPADQQPRNRRRAADPALSEIDASEVMAPVIHMERCSRRRWIGRDRLPLSHLAWRVSPLSRCAICSVRWRASAAAIFRRGPASAGRRDRTIRRSVQRDDQGLAERDRVKKVFGRYVTTQVASACFSRRASRICAGIEGVTILFADIRNFTTMSEKMPPSRSSNSQRVISTRWWTRWWNTRSLDKFIGDGIMACFGSLDDAPTRTPRRACGIANESAAGQAQRRARVAGKDPIHIGIGITRRGGRGQHRNQDRRRLHRDRRRGKHLRPRRIRNKDFGTTLLITKRDVRKARRRLRMPRHAEAKLKGKTNIRRCSSRQLARRADRESA